MLFYQILTSTIIEKVLKTSYKNNKFKISASNGIINLNYLTDDILYRIFKIILSTASKNMRQ